ncbi:hypothetical protein SOMG_02119 [Schizosaccharomyces osmophilus]|uniref:Uncharacterized protein n=1 Tax=Schizosaccharomyces osmophilus TaxID=2545709 RepID=A0AAE9W9L7_9SCHI|nr:uncharacterized protein SOMG_02119 [Schizosaccharomyces osmophilus]WBW71724.1 hypothetical protein SOMG_02119 [Schizosaccharomyces osmophilus]
MNEKERERHLKTVEPAEVACLSSSTSSDSYLPKYSEIPYSHADNMEKGCLCLHYDPVPPYSGNRHQEASTNMAGENIFSISLRNVLTALFWLIFWPAKIARISEAKRRQENEVLRLGWCFIGSIVLDFFFSYFFLVPFIKEPMKESVWTWFQATVAAVLVVMTFYMFLFVFSLLVDSIVILIPLVFSGISSFFSGIFSGISSFFSGIFSGIFSVITSALGFRMSSDRNDLTDDNSIPLNSLPPEPENQFNDRSDDTFKQPSSEHTEQSPGLRQEPGQSRDVESGGN